MQVDKEKLTHPIAQILLDIGFELDEIAVFLEDNKVVQEICYLYELI